MRRSRVSNVAAIGGSGACLSKGFLGGWVFGLNTVLTPFHLSFLLVLSIFILATGVNTALVSYC